MNCFLTCICQFFSIMLSIGSLDSVSFTVCITAKLNCLRNLPGLKNDVILAIFMVILKLVLDEQLLITFPYSWKISQCL